MAIEIVTLRDESTGASAKILAGFGFNCFSFQVTFDDKPIEVLWSAPGFEGGGERPSGSGIPILFPFPGRIQGTELKWDGKTYALPEGDGLGNAIHGFVHERPWRVIEQSENRAVGQFQASVDDPQLVECWPADFRITATYELKQNELATNYLIENPSQHRLPFGLGTHPYFRVPLGDNNARDCVIRVPVSQRWDLVDMIVTGKQTPMEDRQRFHNGLKFSDTSFDNIFGGLTFENEICTTSVHDPESGRTMVMRFDGAFRECVVYNPPHREAICIEPYTCVPDPFRLSVEGIDCGLRILNPGETFSANVRIRVE